MGNLKKYLIWFANEHIDFRFQEVVSIANLFKISIRWDEKPTNHPFWIVELKSDNCAKKLASRSICLRSISELWGFADESETLHQQLKNLPEHIIKPHCEPHLSFKIKVDMFCNSQTQAEKLKKIESFSYLPFQGPVKLKNPDRSFQYTEYYGLDPNTVPSEPYYVFFGRLVSGGQRNTITDMSLKKRKFIGNTSMDPQLALIMANLAKVSNGDLVLDPFVGSGSLLVAAAHYGGFVLGADIDYLMLHGKTKPTRVQDRKKKRAPDENIVNNLKQYKLRDRYLDVVIADSSLPFWRSDLVLDSIITDPPYGLREATERIGTTKAEVSVSESQLPTHIPSKVQYSLAQILSDLLQFATNHLKLGGRLVTWVPVFRSDYNSDDLPQHPCLEMISNCEQILSQFTSRRLLTYEKIAEPLGQKVEVNLSESYSNFREKYFNHVKTRREKENTAEVIIKTSVNGR
ncbi:tRNA (guanine(10)-N(2))-methyltransferase TRMT11 isoform X2 [Lycorma delicatula]|uniref:tRNA (guanine(10)-N(2))-methyltransferase TRMT11 isoform X2 n=1 Tax=Lycorma delicatula TaxID=130591 RepID=UPI003F51199A